MLASVKIMTASASLKFPLYSGVEPLIFKALPLSSFCNLPHDKLDPRRMARRPFDASNYDRNSTLSRATDAIITLKNIYKA